MANHTLHTTPVFDENLRKYETEDEVHADVFNAVDEKLINNDYYLKENLDDVTKNSKEHRENNEIHVTKKQKEEWSAKAENTEVTREKKGLMLPTDKTKLDGIAANAEVNQNAFSNVKVGGTTVAANGKTAAFELVAGTNIKLTADNATKKVTINGPSVATPTANGLMTKEDKIKLNNIANNANNYTHPTSSGNKHIPSGGSSGQILRWSADGTGVWGEDNNTTYPYYNKAIDNNFTTKFRTQTKGNTTEGNYISNVRAEVSNINFAPQYGSGLAWGSFDTHGYLGVSYSGADAYIGGGNADKLNWVKRILLEGNSALAQGVDSSAFGKEVKALGDYSHAEGINTQAIGEGSHAEGFNFSNTLTKACGKGSHAEGFNTIAGIEEEGNPEPYAAHAEGSNTKALGYYSHAEGGGTTASGSSSHTEGSNTLASEYCSHAEGDGTESSGNYSHAEGYQTTASGNAAHAEGYQTTASGNAAHAEGKITTALGNYSHAEGYQTTAGYSTTANNLISAAHAEGGYNIASASFSHAEGSGTTASGEAAHTEGTFTTASKDSSHAGGYYTTANNFASCAIGKRNKVMNEGNDINNLVGDVFVIGNGTSGNSNAFRVTYSGDVYGLSAFKSSGADYAEYFEWLDGNPNNEDRVGYFVTLEGNKIKLAKAGDYLLGIVSGQPCIIGNSDEDWMNRWQHDEFGRFLKKEVKTPITKWKEVQINKENPEEEPNYKLQKVETGEYNIGWSYVENPDYDQTKEYIERKDRKEWSAIGMLGVLSVRDNGACKVNGYCTVGKGGRAVPSNQGYRIIERVTEDIIKVIFK